MSARRWGLVLFWVYAGVGYVYYAWATYDRFGQFWGTILDVVFPAGLIFSPLYLGFHDGRWTLAAIVWGPQLLLGVAFAAGLLAERFRK